MLTALVVSALVSLGAIGVMRLGRGSGVVPPAMRRARRVAVRDVAEGQLVRIVGKVRLMEPALASPLTGRPCAGYQVLVEGVEGWGAMAAAATTFSIEDETGSALVFGDAASLLVRADRRFPAADVPDPVALAELLERQGRSHRVVSACHEGVLADGARVTVIGWARREVDPDPGAHQGYREMAHRVALRARGPHTLFVTNDPAYLR